MQQNPVIFLDMDGVLADFMDPLLKVHNRYDLLAKYKAKQFPMTWDIEGELGTDAELWAPVDAAGAAFWSDIPAYPWMKRLISTIQDTDIPWYICTHARHTSSSYSGKVEWLHKHLGADFENIIMTKHKHLLAHENALLIDDNEHNVNSFKAHGGNACLFPQIWNENRNENKWDLLYGSIEVTFGSEVFNAV